jgi:hypothetical protein
MYIWACLCAVQIEIFSMAGILLTEVRVKAVFGPINVAKLDDICLVFVSVFRDLCCLLALSL